MINVISLCVVGFLYKHVQVFNFIFFCCPFWQGDLQAVLFKHWQEMWLNNWKSAENVENVNQPVTQLKATTNMLMTVDVARELDPLWFPSTWNMSIGWFISDWLLGMVFQVEAMTSGPCIVQHPPCSSIYDKDYKSLPRCGEACFSLYCNSNSKLDLVESIMETPDSLKQANGPLRL